LIHFYKSYRYIRIQPSVFNQDKREGERFAGNGS